MEVECSFSNLKLKYDRLQKGGFFIANIQSIMYYNEDTIVYYKGQFIKAVEARGNVYDQSLHYGYAVFEGIRSYHTEKGVQIFKAKEHFDRLRFSAEAVSIPYHWSTEELTAISYEVLQRNNLKDGYLRPLVSCAPNMSLTKPKQSELLIAAWAWPALLGEKLLKLKTSSYRRISPASFKVEAKVSGHYVNSILASQEARDLGYDEALLLDINGYAAEGPGSNLFIEKDRVLYTPQLGSILPGITRATIIELAHELGIEIIEKQLTLQEVYNANSAFYCGTAAEVVGIGSLDDKAFPKPWKESLGATLQKVYKNLVLQKEYRTIEKIA